MKVDTYTNTYAHRCIHIPRNPYTHMSVHYTPYRPIYRFTCLFIYMCIHIIYTCKDLNNYKYHFEVFMRYMTCHGCMKKHGTTACYYE